MRSLSIATVIYLLLAPWSNTNTQAEEAVVYWEAAQLARAKQQAEQPPEPLERVLNALKKSAEAALRRGPYSVMQKKEVPPSGDKHDYLSYSRYWWPNPDTKDGLPYVRHDGKTNVEMRSKGDRDRIGLLYEDVESLVLAAYFFEDDKYAKHACKLIHTWFLDPQTRMNPNLNYGQAVLGRSEGRGVGIIDTRGFIIVLDSIALLSNAGHLSDTDLQALKQWFQEYLTWLRTSKLGHEEASARNNHGSWYAAQVARIALFVGAEAVAREVVLDVKTRRIPNQFKSDGRQPYENERTKSLHYCFFNLSALSVVARVSEQLGIDLWKSSSEVNGSIKMGLHYLLPYLTDQQRWPHKQIDKFTLSRRSIQLLRMASVRYHCSDFFDGINRVDHRHDLQNYASLVSAAWPSPSEEAKETAIAVQEGVKPELKVYRLPDISAYSVDSVRRLRPKITRGVITIGPTSEVPLLEEAFRRERGKDLRARQSAEDTQIIKIQNGAVTLRQLVQQVGDESIASEIGSVVTLRLPVLIQPGTTLIVDGSETPELRLSTDRGAFITNAGTLFVLDAEVTSWDESNEQPSEFVEAKAFRPYISSYIRSKTYLAGSTFSHLGYYAPTAYGLSLSSHPERERGEPSDDWPTGQIVNNVFRGLFYGFYSFEARDVAIVGNTYDDSIRYGIDPHDRSTRLIIANNIAKSTRERHGIIGSRGVSDSFIFGNKSFDNTQSGIMLDRQCTGNVVAENQVFQNGQGIAIYESPNNIIAKNVILQNDKSGIRVRNSIEISIQENQIIGNSDYGLEFSSKRLADHDKRMARGDLYLRRVAASLLSNTVTGNTRGCAKGNQVQYLRLHNFLDDFDATELEAILSSAPLHVDTSDDHAFGSELKPHASTLLRVFEPENPIVIFKAG